MKIIETEIWEPVPDKPGYVRFVKGRKIIEVYKELYEALSEMKLLPDEYFLLSHRIGENEEFPRDAVIRATTQWGSNEGIYIDVDIVTRDERVHFITGKTLSETTEAFDWMNYIAGTIYKLFAGEGRSSAEQSYSGDFQSTYTQRAVLYSLFQEIARKALFDNDFSLSDRLDDIEQIVRMTELLDAGGSMTEEDVKTIIDEIIKTK